MPRRCYDRANFKKMNYLKIFSLIICIILLTACSSRLLTVHKIDVQQGNALDVEMVDKISIGMSKEQVRYVLGTPLITDSFHPDRWDYIYLFIPGYGERQRRQLTVIFDRDEVIDIFEQNIVKNETEITASTSKDDEDEENLSEKEKKELEEAEEQASTLKETFETNEDLE